MQQSCGPTSHTAAILLASVAVISSAGCYIKNLEYPKTWPAMSIQADIETRIAGTYQCAGEIVESNAGLYNKRNLAHFFLGGENPPYCTSVEIRRPNSETLEIQYAGGGQALHGVTRIYKKNVQYRVEDGWIELGSGGTSAAEDIVAAHESLTPVLTIDEEGALIVKAQVSTIGVIVIVPAGTSGTDWGRFRRIQ